MEITNKTGRPLKVPLPGGKTLFLGPGKTAKVNPKSEQHAPLLQLVESGDVEIVDDSRKGGGSRSAGSGGVSGDQGVGPSSNIRRTGDR